MDNNLSKKIDILLLDIKKQLLLVYSENDTQEIMTLIQEHINNFMIENPSATIEDIKNCVYNMGDFIQSGLYDIDFHVLLKKIQKTNGMKKCQKIIIRIGLIIIILYIIYCIYDMIYIYKTSPAYVEEEIVVLDETVYPDETDSTEFSSESSFESVE